MNFRIWYALPAAVVFTSYTPNVASLDLTALIHLFATLTSYFTFIFSWQAILNPHYVILWAFVTILAKFEATAALVATRPIVFMAKEPIACTAVPEFAVIALRKNVLFIIKTSYRNTLSWLAFCLVSRFSFNGVDVLFVDAFRENGLRN